MLHSTKVALRAHVLKNSLKEIQGRRRQKNTEKTKTRKREHTGKGRLASEANRNPREASTSKEDPYDLAWQATGKDEGPAETETKAQSKGVG